MKIRAVTLWTPKSADGVVKGMVYEHTKYVAGELKEKVYREGVVMVKGIELSPTSEFVLLLHSGDVKVYGYCPYALELDAEDGTSDDRG